MVANRITATVVGGLLSVCGFAAMASQAWATPLADSVAEFSGTQGQDHWYYGYYDRTSDPDHTYSGTEFQQMTQCLTGPSVNYDSIYIPAWHVQDGSYWTALFANGGIPNGLDGNGGRLRFEHWSARRWISEVSGPVDISGVISNQTMSSHNGFVGRIFVDGTEVWSQYIAGGDYTGVEYSISPMVSLGSTVDFMIDPYQSSDISDHIRFTATIAPEPTTLVSLALAGLFLRRR